MDTERDISYCTNRPTNHIILARLCNGLSVFTPLPPPIPSTAILAFDSAGVTGSVFSVLADFPPEELAVEGRT
jgi:hypothetical protein